MRTGAAARGETATAPSASASDARTMRFMDTLLSCAEQDLHRELIEPLVAEAARRERGAIEAGREQIVAVPRGVRGQPERAAVGAERRDERPNLGVLAPLPRALLQDQIRSHAAAREVEDAGVVLRTIRVRVEMPRAVVADLLQELHEEERRLHVRRAEAEIL